MATKAYDIEPGYFNSFCQNAVKDYLGIEPPHRGKMFYTLIKDAHANVIEVTTNFDDRRFVITRDIHNDEIRMVVGNKTIKL